MLLVRVVRFEVCRHWDIRHWREAKVRVRGRKSEKIWRAIMRLLYCHNLRYSMCYVLYLSKSAKKSASWEFFFPYFYEIQNEKHKNESSKIAIQIHCAHKAFKWNCRYVCLCYACLCLCTRNIYHSTRIYTNSSPVGIKLSWYSKSMVIGMQQSIAKWKSTLKLQKHFSPFWCIIYVVWWIKFYVCEYPSKANKWKRKWKWKTSAEI